MKKIPHHLLALSFVAIAAGCTPSPTSTDPTPDYNAGAEYVKNVSTMYSIGNVTTDGSMIPMQWKDSNGYVRSFSNDSGKAQVLTFFSTTSVPAQAEIAALDSLAEVLGDSVKVYGIAIDNTIHSFATVSSYIASNKRKLQVIVDSTGAANREFIELSDEQYYMPETFIFKPDMMESDVLAGYFPLDSLLAHTRASWR